MFFLATCLKLEPAMMRAIEKRVSVMKKVCKLSMMAVVLPFSLICSNEETSKTFMFIRPVYHNLAAEQSLWHDFEDDKVGELRGAFQCTTYFQDSRHLSKTARYFLLNKKDKIVISGDADEAAPIVYRRRAKDRDVRAEWLGIASDPMAPFSGCLCIQPEQRQTCFAFEYNQHLSRFTDMSFLKNYWFSLMMPLVIVENDINVAQSGLVNTPKTGPKDLIEAFNQSSWCAGKFRPCKKSIFQLGEVRLKLGYSFVNEDKNQLSSYTLISIPAAKELDPEFLFDTYAGFNNHFGFGGGVNMQFLLNEDAQRYAVSLYANLQAVFYIRGKECRLIDLKGKPWSRYVRFNRLIKEPVLDGDIALKTDIPGVNVLRRQVIVRPYGCADFSTGLRMTSSLFDVEVGYSLWGKGDEKIKLRRPFPQEFGIAGSTPTTTASASTIEWRAVDDEKFVPITECDLDLNAAAAQSIINHRFHLFVGKGKKGRRYDGFCGVGAYYEYAQRNSTLEVWGVWVKLGGSF